MEKLVTSKISRSALGSVLVIAALFAVVGAWAFEALGFRGTGIRPLSFVSALVAVKLSLFAFWPALSGKGRTALTETYLKLKQAYKPRPSSMALWNEHDPRLDLSLSIRLSTTE